MKCLSLIICLLVLLPGCCGTSSNAPTNPFYGYTRVPPPATGSIHAQSADPYYQGAPNSGPGSTAPLYNQPNNGVPNTLPSNPGATMTPVNPGTTPSGTLPSRTAPYTPPNNTYNYQSRAGSSRADSSSRVPHLADRSTRPTNQGIAGVRSRNPVFQATKPRPKATPTPAPRGRSIDIMDLPDSNRRSTPDRAAVEPKSRRNGFRLVSANDGDTDPNQVVAAVASSQGNVASTLQGRYGHDPDYRRLRGKLEHSQVDGCWKLRYIPIDGATDDYGGSVVLPDESLLSGMERGDFVEVRGKIGKRDAASQGFAPTYLATKVARISH